MKPWKLEALVSSKSLTGERKGSSIYTQCLTDPACLTGKPKPTTEWVLEFMCISKRQKMVPVWSLVEMGLCSGAIGESDTITVVRKIIVPVARCSMEPPAKL